MEKYQCICEALDYGKNPSALEDLKKALESIDGITITGSLIEDGAPEDGAGAGILVEVTADRYENVNRQVREITSKMYQCTPEFYRLGLGIYG